jgi:hypothetical protein
MAKDKETCQREVLQAFVDILRTFKILEPGERTGNGYLKENKASSQVVKC